MSRRRAGPVIGQIQGWRAAFINSLFPRPRNLTSGTLKALNPNLARQRPLNFIPHGLGVVEGFDADGHGAAIDALDALGLAAAGDLRSCGSLDEVLAHHESLLARRATLPFEVDGSVIKVDDFELQRRLGLRSRSPRWHLMGAERLQQPGVPAVDQAGGKERFIHPKRKPQGHARAARRDPEAHEEPHDLPRAKRGRFRLGERKDGKRSAPREAAGRRGFRALLHRLPCDSCLGTNSYTSIQLKRGSTPLFMWTMG